VVNFARETGALLAVRCGMHNPAGFSVVDDGIVLDLSLLKGIRVDPNEQLATVQGGCTFGDVDHATHAFGLATPGGVLSTPGWGSRLGAASATSPGGTGSRSTTSSRLTSFSPTAPL
jgi:FAD/FMN-containing dehydrogenase